MYNEHPQRVDLIAFCVRTAKLIPKMQLNIEISGFGEVDSNG